MNLHEDKDAFAELVTATAQSIGLPEVYIEKDYWITKALKHLFESEYGEFAVFKGGTSLSKAYRLIQRFSEDIDLAVFAKEAGDAKRKKLIKNVEKATYTGLIPVPDDVRVSKGSRFRKTVYRYPQSNVGGDFGQASTELLIEVNAFTHPEPFEQRKIQTFITDLLADQKRDDLIDQYGLKPFPINVLSMRRTLVEKILGIVKDSYHDDPVTRLSVRIRHLYDICLILRQREMREFVESSEFKALCTICINDEKSGLFDDANYLDNPLSDAPIFSEFESWKARLEPIYNGAFSDLVYGDLPSINDVGETLNFIRKNT